MTRCGRIRWAWVIALFGLPVFGGHIGAAQVTMPNPKEMSGSVLPVSDLPAGTVTVRLIRGGFDKNLTDAPVDFFVNDAKRTVKTDAAGRAQVTGLAKGTRVRAVAVVDGEKLESREAVVDTTGLRIILVATDPEAEKRSAEDAALAKAKPVKGIVVLGPESRIIAQITNDRLDIYYVLQIVNSARTPVDIGGPLVFDLPREARSTTIIEGSSKQATANGPRVRIVGPFAPGVTSVQAAYDLPFSGGTARVRQVWPAKLEQVALLVQQVGGLSVSSSQLTARSEISESGQPVIIGTGPGLAAGEALTFEISGLPHHATWPRTLALSLAGAIVAAGIWGAATARPRAA